MTSVRADVLVIGSGPAGSVAAFQLAKAGFDTLLVDRASFPREKVCGESLSPGALMRLRAIGMWEPDSSPASSAQRQHPPLRVEGMKIRSPRGTTFFGRYQTSKAGTGQGLAMRRVALDNELMDQARSRGVRVLERVEAFKAEVSSSGEAVVRARGVPTRTEVRIEAKRVIVADGRRSFLARDLGFIEAQDRNRARGRRFAVRAHCGQISGLSNLAEMHVGDGGYCGLAPLSATTANVCYVRFGDRLAMTPRSLEEDFRREISKYPHVEERLGGTQFLGQVRVIGPLRLESRRQQRGPFIACGDASGFLDPFTGEGIAHAIASGVLGAEAVRLSIHGDSGAFANYEKRIRSLRRIKGTAALVVHALVSNRRLADSAAGVFARVPRLGDLAVRLFGDQI